MSNKKTERRFNFSFIFNKDKERLSSSTILVRGSLLTCIILSFASGIIDIAFFSGLSKALLHVGTVPMHAAILYTVISVGFISAKFWLAMKLGMLKELQARLTAKQFSWSKNLDKPIRWTSFWHKFMIAISIMTALSLSVNSIGSALKDAERNSTNITISIDELKALKDQKKADSNDKRNLARGNLEGRANSKQTAEKEADRYWPNIENWQNKLNAIYLSDEYLALETDEEKAACIAKARAPFKKMAPTFVGNNIDYISRSELVTRFQQEAKKTEVDKESIAAYDALTNENNEEIKNTIMALENLYKHPNSYENGLVIEGKPVSFLDENGEPIDITQVIGLLQGLREEWKNNTDIGESSQIFMLVSEIITSKVGEDKSSGSGVAEILMIIIIAIIGIGQEFLIAHFTPKATIDRSLLRQVSEYLYWEDKNQKERFLLEVYDDYYGDGVFNQDAFEHKCKKAVEHLERSIDDTIFKYSKRNKDNAKPIKRNKKAVSIQTVLSDETITESAQENNLPEPQIEEIKQELEQVKPAEKAEPTEKAESIEESELIKEPEPVKKQESNEPQEEIDDELDSLIKEAETRIEG